MPETTNPQPDDLPARLEAVLTERFTELGNPFSEMRRHEEGPDGWPASHPVGPHHVAEVLRELLAVVPAPPSVPADQAAEAHRLALSEALGLGTGAPWDAIHERTAVLQQRADAMERAMESTAADALKHRGCHRDLMGQCLRAEQAEAAVERVRSVLESEAVVGRSALDYRGLITVALMADQPAPAPGRVAGEAPQPETQAAPADRTALRDRIAETLMPFFANFSSEDTARVNAGEAADAVLAVLPEPADRAAEWRAAADHIEAMRGYPSLMVPEEAVDELRRVAGEAQHDETQAGLKRAHVALAAQAGRDQAAVARVRAYVASQTDALPSGYPVAVPAADVLAALDGSPAVVSQPGKDA